MFADRFRLQAGLQMEEKKKKKGWGLPPNSEPPWQRGGGLDRPNDPATKRIDFLFFLVVVVALIAIPIIFSDSFKKSASSNNADSIGLYLYLALLILYGYLYFKRRK